MIIRMTFLLYVILRKLKKNMHSNLKTFQKKNFLLKLQIKKKNKLNQFATLFHFICLCISWRHEKFKFNVCRKDILQ